MLISFPAIAGLRATLLVGLVFSNARNPSVCGLVSSLLCCKCGSLPIFFLICSTSRFRSHYSRLCPAPPLAARYRTAYTKSTMPLYCSVEISFSGTGLSSASNRRIPAPRMVGITLMWKRSTSPRRIACCATLAPPQSQISPAASR